MGFLIGFFNHFPRVTVVGLTGLALGYKALKFKNLSYDPVDVLHRCPESTFLMKHKRETIEEDPLLKESYDLPSTSSSTGVATAGPVTGNKPPYYYADCFEMRQVARPKMEDPAPDHVGHFEEDIVVRFANEYFDTFPMKVEVFVSGLLTGNKRPAGRLSFNLNDKLGHWVVEYRSDSEIVLRSDVNGYHERTLFGVRSAPESSRFMRDVPVLLQLGTALWPHPEGESPAERGSMSFLTRASIRGHSLYTRAMLGAAGQRFQDLHSRVLMED